MYSNISSINIEFSEAMEMIFMVEELLEGNASDFLSPEAFKGMSTTLKVARNILRHSEQRSGFDRIDKVVEEKSNLGTSNLENHELPKLNKLGTEDLTPVRKKLKKRTSNKSSSVAKDVNQEVRKAPKIHMTRKALRTGLL